MTCATCDFASWYIGGKCLRPPAGMRTKLRENDRFAPVVGKEDYCGDHLGILEAVAKRRADILANPRRYGYNNKAIAAAALGLRK